MKRSPCIVLSALIALVGTNLLSAQTGCITVNGGAGYTNTPFASQTGSFTATFDATPSVTPTNSVIAFSNGAQTSNGGFATVVSFSDTKDILALNGATYTAATTIAYVAGATYHFRVVVDVTSHTYSIFVTPPGGSELTIGSNFAFRTALNTVTMLNNMGNSDSVTPGSMTVCNFAVSTSGGGGTFSLSASPSSESVTAGSSASYTVTVTPSGGFTGTVVLGAAGLPTGASASFSPASIAGGSGTSTMTVTTSSSTPTATFPLTITGTSGLLTASTPVSLTVTPVTGAGDFTIAAASGAPSVDPGIPYPYAVWVKPVNGFSGTVAFSVSGLPSGATAAFRTASRTNPLGASVTTNINGGPAESTLTVTPSSSTPAGTSTLTITAISGGVSHSTTATLTVNPQPSVFHVTCGGSNDTAAVNSAIASASSAGGGIVEIPAGATCSTASIHMMSDVRLQLDAGSTIKGHSGIDAPESIGCSDHQDFGHSHFHDALIWGEGLHNIAIQGSGTITGNGVLSTGTPGGGDGDKAVSFKECTNVTITGVTITDGGHFGILTNGTNNISVSNVKILDSHNRDAFNLINATNAVIDNSDIEGSDDSMVLKSDWGLCTQGTNANIYVSNSLIFSTGNNATQFGSETCGNFTNVNWANLNLTESGKAGIGITSNDGAIIDGVTYDNINIAHAADPIYLKVDNQARCPVPSPGLIRNVSISNVSATTSESGSTGTFSNTINGFNAAGHHVSNVTVTNTQYTSPGGKGNDTSEPPENNNWPPNSLGERPAYGWFVRHADNITFLNNSVNFTANDDRAAFWADDGTFITVDGFTFERGSGSTCDLVFDSVNPYHVGPTSPTPPKVCASGSSTF